MTEKLSSTGNTRLTPRDVRSHYLNIAWKLLNSQNTFTISLLENGLSINAKDDRGETLLFHIVREGLERHIDALIEVGADVSVTNENGHNAADIAYKFGYVQIWKKLEP